MLSWLKPRTGAACRRLATKAGPTPRPSPAGDPAAKEGMVRASVFMSAPKGSMLPYQPHECSELLQWTKEKAELFSLPVKFVSPSDLNHALPTNERPEIAFIGRSNVGKSSLVESLLGNRGLLRISKEPGCTKTLNFFSFSKNSDPWLYLVDMPGYGFAKVTKTQQEEWLKIMNSYLLARHQLLLRRVFVLIDSRRGVQQPDLDMMMMLNESVIPYQVILTKQDLVNDFELRRSLAGLYSIMGRMKQSAFLPVVHVISSKTGMGMDNLKLAITELTTF